VPLLWILLAQFADEPLLGPQNYRCQTYASGAGSGVERSRRSRSRRAEWCQKVAAFIKIMDPAGVVECSIANQRASNN
jgi:hypothetical protein